MRRTILLSAILATVVGGLAAAQPTQRVVERPAPGRQEGMVRVQMSISLFVSGPTDETEAAEKHRERARRVLYEMAARECDLMRDVIARDCRLESVNVNLNRQVNQQMQGYQVMGNMAYQITLK